MKLRPLLEDAGSVRAPLVLLLSGGLDSTTLLYWLVDRGAAPEHVYPIMFFYGQRHDKEVMLATANALTVGVPRENIQLTDLPFLKTFSELAQCALVNRRVPVPTIQQVLGDPQPATYVPFRNMLFLVTAAAYAEAVEARSVFFGAQLHDQYGYWDTTEQFVEAMNAVTTLNRRNPVRVFAPFARLRKADIIREGTRLGVNYQLTWSCYRGGELACGVCPTCSERLKGFKDAGIMDPVMYEFDVPGVAIGARKALRD